MKKNTIRTTAILGLALVGAVAVLSYTADAVRMLRAQPTAVATVNLSDVLIGLEERAAAEMDLEKMSAGFSTEEEGKLKEIKTLEEALPDIVDPQAQSTARDELELKKLQYLAWQRVKVEQLDIEQSLRLQDLYKKITAAIGDMANTEGYDLVIVDDSSSEFSYNPDARVSREIQTKQQIVGRRVLWRNDAIDVTDAMVQRMNNAYQAAAQSNTTNSKATGQGAP